MSKPKSGLFKGTKGEKTPIAIGERKANGQTNGNKIHHIFHKDQHGLREFLKSFNNDEAAALNRLNQEYNKYIKNSHIKDGFLKIKVNINGFEITIRGIVIDGVGHIGTAYQGDD